MRALTADSISPVTRPLLSTDMTLQFSLSGPSVYPQICWSSASPIRPLTIQLIIGRAPRVAYCLGSKIVIKSFLRERMWLYPSLFAYYNHKSSVYTNHLVTEMEYTKLDSYIAQTASRRFPNAAARVLFRFKSCAVHVGQIGSAAGFLRILRGYRDNPSSYYSLHNHRIYHPQLVQ
jgi:hypothetical protein